MNESPESGFPFYYVVIAFAALTLLNIWLSKYLRKRRLLRDGQLPFDGKRAPGVRERIARNRHWAKGKIPASGMTPMVILWILALTWNLTFGVSFIKSLSNADAQTAQKVVLGIFSLLGIVPVFFAIRFTIQFFRYGKSWCLIEGLAGVLGKEMKGRIQSSVEIEATGDYELTLQCLDTYSTGSGKNRTTKSDVKFQATSKVPSKGVRSKSGIPFSFPLPPYPPETGDQLARGNVTWQLRVTAPVKGVDYSAMFIIPVFKLDE